MPSPLRSATPLPFTFAASGPSEDPPAGSSSSTQAPGQNQQTDRSKNSRAPRTVRLLPADRVVSASTSWIETYRTSSSESEKFLANTLLSHLQTGTLELGNPASQSLNRAQYGKRITQQGNRPAAMVVNFTVRADGQLAPFLAALRDELSKEVVATIRAPKSNAELSYALGAESSSAPTRTYIDLTRDTVEPESSVASGQKHPLNVSEGSSGDSSPQAGPSTKRVLGGTPEPSHAASASGSAPAVFTAMVKHATDEIVKTLVTWEQEKARTGIEQKLGTASTELEQMVMISSLKARLTSAANKLGEITAWIDTATTGDIAAAIDTRTTTERRLQDQLAAQKKNPDFNQAFEDICRMISGKNRKDVIRASYIKSGNYRSPLFKRVFADSRGPLKAIQAIRDHLEAKIDVERYQALLDWTPQKH